MKRDLALRGGQNCQLGGPVRGFEGTCPTQCILKEALGCSNIFFISVSIACAPVFTQKCVVCATSSKKVSVTSQLSLPGGENLCR